MSMLTTFLLHGVKGVVDEVMSGKSRRDEARKQLPKQMAQLKNASKAVGDQISALGDDISSGRAIRIYVKSTKVNTGPLDRMIKNLSSNVDDAVARLAFQVEGEAKIRAPVDTGALRASIYTSIQGHGNGRTAMNAAMSKRPDAGVVALPTPRDSHTAHVGPSVEYAGVVELGSSRRPGTPYLQPAMRTVELSAKRAFGDAVKFSLR